MSAVVLNDANFSEITKEGIVLVDFWAEWCGPCQIMLPILEDFSKEVEGKVIVGKVNVDEAPSIASQFRVMSIPTLIVFKDGKMVENMVGVHQKDQLKAICDKYL